MNSEKLNVVYLGSSGFPYGLASIQRLKLISKGLVESGADVLILNNKSPHKRNECATLPNQGTVEGVKYIYTAGTPYRENNILKRNILKIYGLINELFIINKLYFTKNLAVAIISTMSFYTVFYYSMLSKIYKFATILNYTEYITEKREYNNNLLKFNYFLYSKYGFKLVDGVWPISDYLVKQIERTAPGKKYIKVPILVDIDKFMTAENINKEKYFLYCGSLGYFEVIEFIVKAYDRIGTDLNKYGLNLVVNGDPASFDKLTKLVNLSGRRESIKILSNLSEKDLTDYYQKAAALLIPLRSTIQDEARFPHKIGEYLASGNPIITTNIGEIKKYFKDEVNALVADRYDIDDYANKMKYVIFNPQNAQKIGKVGREIAYANFDYRKNGANIRSFIDGLINNRFR